MLLATRLKSEHAFKTIPEIAEQTIKAPIFVTGLPRSGTSALLNLLVAAPDNRGLLQWEAQFPE
ncbi:MAG: sulfotransferase, partial [Halioglobus sp.]